jgi:hypothetical protein
MNVTLRYTQLGLAVAALLDKEEPLDAGQAQQYIEDGSLFSWLGRRYDGEIDLSLYEAADQADVLERFQALSDTVDTERTFGIESSGLALLAAYCFEVLQEIHYFKEPKLERVGIIDVTVHGRTRRGDEHRMGPRPGAVRPG